MSVRIVLACGEAGVTEAFGTVVAESVDLELAEIVDDGRHVLDTVDASEADVLVLHEALGPIPSLELLREVALARPALGVVLLVAESRPETYAAAMESGARTLLTLPLSVEEVNDRIEAAAHWSRTVRSHLAGESLYGGGQRGTIVAVAGAKGGVGASVLAVGLAVQATDDGRRVCLVDLDLQNGDIAMLLGIDPRRSVIDLAEVADEITVRSLDEIAFRLDNGLTVLVAPERGEDGEDLPARSARMIFSALRMQFDVVVVDCGSAVDDATALVVELADQALLVTTPDVPALRAARRRLDLWERLQVRKPDDVGVVLNRVSRKVEIQPDLAARVLGATALTGTLPAAFGELEEAVNTSTLATLRNGGYLQAVATLAAATGLTSTGGRRPTGRRSRRTVVAPVTDSGQVIAETPVVVALLVLVTMIMFQLLLWGWSHVLATNAAQEAARVAAVSGDTCAAARASMSNGWGLDGCPSIDRASGNVRVSVTTPTIVPGLGRLTASARTSFVTERP